MRFAVFFSLLLAALVVINAFVYRRTAHAFRLSPRARRVLLGLLVAGLLAVVLGRTVERFVEADLPRTVSRVGMIAQLGVIIAFAVLALERLAGLLVRAVRVLRAWWRRRNEAPARPRAALPEVEQVEVEQVEVEQVEVEQVEEPHLGRRELLSRAVAGSALALGAGSSLYGALVGRRDYVIEEVPIQLAKLPRTLEGFTIVQLSDIHLGTFVGEREVASAIDLVRQAAPDLVVLTGDHVDHDARYADMLGALVARLRELAPVAAVPGNHDYYAGIGVTSRAIQRAGAELLVNRSVLIGDRGGRIALAGVDDVWARRQGGRGPDIAAAVRGVPDELARVLLCHNPVLFPETAAHVDLQLSGHTHGGQFNPGVRPADLFLPFGYVSGHYRRDGSQLYVNRGFGTAGPPARLGAAPEVTKFVLTG
jgi:hypothetical protein